GLDDFRPRSHGTTRKVASSSAAPLFTTASGTHYLAPGDVNSIYGKTALPSSVTGSGVTIAVVGQSDINLSDIAAFQTAAGLPLKAPSVTTYGSDPGSPAADLAEAEMDLEWAGAIAPGANILYVNSNDAIAGSLTEAVDYNVAPIISTSYGNCEENVGVSAIAYLQLLFEMANTEGITIVAASGDSGATDCDVNVGSAVKGLAVDFPASSPMVTAVGGTEFNEGSGTYLSSMNGGAPTGSAAGYIPEIVWNDDNTAGFSATGGGASAYFSKPTWQIGTGVPNDFARDVPDVSLAASINHDGFLICVGSSNCTSGFSNSTGGYVVSGGTSAATSSFAGMLALVEQQAGSRLGNINPTLYSLANSSYGASVFHDVTSGTNASACTAGTPSCTSAGTIGFAAGVGYDQATGWGSVNTANLVNDWSLVLPLPTTSGQYPSVTNLTGSLNSAVAGTPIAFTLTEASATTLSTTMPTGTVQMTVDGVAVGTAVTLSSGSASYSLDTTSLSAGTHTVQATYAGDTTYAGSRAAFVITITAAGGPDFALTPSTANITVKSGNVATAVVLTATSIGGFGGTVTFTASLVAPLAARSSFTFNPVTVATTSAATTQFSLLAYTYNSKLEKPLLPFHWKQGGAGMVLALVVLAMLPRRRRLQWLVLIVSVATLGLSGCGAAATPTKPTAPATTGTPAGTYTVLIQGLANINGAVVEHTTTITYVVQ
ncbi:MAG: Ig-like domain repeat protein, partial [Bryocella sp.]